MSEKDKAALFAAIVAAIQRVGVAEFKKTSLFGRNN